MTSYPTYPKLTLLWIAATALAGAIVGALESAGWQFFATLVVSGFAVGLAQWCILRPYLRRASWWVVASTFGWIAGVFLQVGLTGVISPIATALAQRVGWEVLWLNVIDQPINAVVFGVAQWLVLRRTIPQSSGWIGISAIAGIAHGATGATVCYLACQPLSQATSGFLAGAIAYGSGWAAYGIVTGWALERLLRLHPPITSPQKTHI